MEDEQEHVREKRTRLEDFTKEELEIADYVLANKKFLSDETLRCIDRAAFGRELTDMSQRFKENIYKMFETAIEVCEARGQRFTFD